MASSRLGRYLKQRGAADYDHLWEWSVAPDTAGEFWADVARMADIRWHRPPDAVLEPDPSRVPGAAWFRGGLLNYAERALQPPGGAHDTVAGGDHDTVAGGDHDTVAGGDHDRLAVIAHSQTRPDAQLTWRELRDMVARVRGGLIRAGVGSGDRVAGYLPNIPEALAAMLAAASIGAVWTCCSPDMGPAGVLDRLTQVEPVVLIAVDGYRYGSRAVDRRDEAEALHEALSGLKAAVWLPYLNRGGAPPEEWTAWDNFTADPSETDAVGVEFDHPLYVLFSSGTTGRPKAIVHGHGGILVEHAKALAFHFDLGPGDRFFWFTTTGWMMWNFVVSGLLVGATVVLFDGDPGWPAPDQIWEIAERDRLTCLGVGSAYLVSCMRQGMKPAATRDLSALKTVGATGSPLPASAAEWAYQAVAADMMLASFSGGTDVCTGFVGASPLHPVWAGEISCRCLGARVEVFDEEGRPVVSEEGELVLTAPLPSMPVGFWGDPDGARYRAAYFERFPGVWAHGDRATLTERGTVIITGRSDGTLNRGGVRMGTSEFYSVVESQPAVADSLVVHVEDPGGGPGELWLFVVPADPGPPGVRDPGPPGVRDPGPPGVRDPGPPGVRDPGPPGDGDPGAGMGPLEQDLRSRLRAALTPRHVPDHIVVVPAIPRTLTGKKMEVPVKRLLAGVDPAQALAVEAVADPASLEPFLKLAGLMGKRHSIRNT
jgi:acetoacetyl-CoA synthetase